VNGDELDRRRAGPHPPGTTTVPVVDPAWLAQEVAKLNERLQRIEVRLVEIVEELGGISEDRSPPPEEDKT